MPQSRRSFLKSLSAAALAAGYPATTRADPQFSVDRYAHAGDPLFKDLAARALDAAKAAGASYADVRFTRTRTEVISSFGTGSYQVQTDDEHGAVGVRALTDGAWGFASSPLWTPDEAARLGRDAASQAKYNARGHKRKVSLGNAPPAVTGEWTTPIKTDPFNISLAEKLEVMWALNEIAERLDEPATIGSYMILHHRRQEKTFASTDGSFITQTLFVSHPHLLVFAQDNRGIGQSRTLDAMQPAQVGWERMAGPSYGDAIPDAVDEAVRALDAERVTPDRYDIVLDALAMAQLVAMTIAVPAELDRVLGYEANAGGTSYLAPPEEMLGKFALGPRFLNVAANRSRAGVIGTVKWDDEGVVPTSYPVIKDGVLVSYHTNRELAAAQGTPSTGNAASDNASQFTLLQPPNIEMLPGTSDVSLNDLVSQLDHGLVILGGAPGPGSHGIVSVDRQQLNGEIGGGMVYEVKKGKRVGYLRNVECLFRSPDLWKSLKAIGGQRSQVWTASTIGKGQPNQNLTFGSAGVPALFTKVAVTDITRRA